MSQSETRRLDGEARNRIERVIKEFLAKDWYDGLFETRIQKLIFFTEVYCIVHYRKRLTKAAYKPFMYGAYSEDIRRVLETMSGTTRKRKIKHGERTIEYSIDSFESGENDAIRKIIDQVHEATKFQSTPDLAQFSKDSWLFENTKYDKRMKFKEFVEALEECTDVESELKDELPDRVDLREDELNDLVSITN